MGNPDDGLARVRDRAVEATDVSFVICENAPGSPIVWVNGAFTRTTGYTLVEVIGRNPSMLQGPDTDPAEVARLGAAVREGRAGTATVLNYDRDGVAFWNQVSLSPIRDEQDRITHWVGIQVDVTAQVLDRVARERSVASERRARAGLRIVEQVSDLLSDLDDPYVLREIAGLLRGTIAAWSAFYLDDHGLRPAVGIDVTGEPAERALRHPRALVQPDGGRAVPDPVQDLLDGVVEGPHDVPLRGAATGTMTEWLVDQLGEQLAALPEPRDVVVVVPVPGRRRVLGLLVVAPVGPAGVAALDANDRSVLYLTVRRVGMAIDNVRLYNREHRLAETLQRAMLPEQADVPWLDVWTYYAPNSEHAQVGGDWYDVLQLSDDDVGVVIGDVVGHDVEAAAAMGQLRSVVRSYAHEKGAPGAVLERVDQLIGSLRIPRSASLVFATISRVGGRWNVCYSRAGHLPVLRVRDRRVVTLDGAGGPLVGFGGAPRATAEAELLPGDVLVFYTDGLIERRDRALRDGLAALVEAAGEVTALDAAGIGEELLARLADAPEDDVAVVVLRVPDPATDSPAGAPSPRQRRWLLPSEPASIGRARHAVLRTSAAWELTETASAELVVSELVANAVLHGWGHIGLRLFDTGDGLRIEVEDANPAPPVATDGHPGRVGGYGMQIVERLADWGWRRSGPGKVVWARVRPGSSATL